jgi:ATP-dependent protease ClpP protease subunit
MSSGRTSDRRRGSDDAVHLPFIRFILAFILILLMPKLAISAAISVSLPIDSKNAATVVVQGELIASDVAEFKSKTGPLSQAVVWLQSDGGSVLTGIQMGEVIRLKGFATFVPERGRCASACALAWLGGSPRYMAARAKIGFHAAYNATSGQETGVGNALVGAYLARIGLPYSAVVYITQASPRSMTWLSLADAKRQGIEVSLKSGDPTAPIPQKLPAEVSGYSVQVSSQRSEPDALAAYQSLQRKFPSILGGQKPIIHRADLSEHGIFYRAHVGPFRTAEEASDLCGHLKAAGGMCIVQRE